MTPRRRKQITCTSSSNTTVITLPWMLAAGAQTLHVTDEMRAELGNLEQTVQHRFASVRTDQPGSWTVEASGRTSNGAGVTEVDVSGATDQMFMQVGLTGKVTSGAVAQALSALQASASGAGRLIAARTYDLQQYNSGNTVYLQLARPFAAVGIKRMMFAVELAGGVSGTVNFRPAWRTAEALGRFPDAWTDLDTNQAETAAATYNSGLLTTTLSSARMWAQPGLKISTSGQGILRVLVAAKWD